MDLQSFIASKDFDSKSASASIFGTAPENLVAALLAMRDAAAQQSYCWRDKTQRQLFIEYVSNDRRFDKYCVEALADLVLTSWGPYGGSLDGAKLK